MLPIPEFSRHALMASTGAAAPQRKRNAYASPGKCGEPGCIEQERRDRFGRFGHATKRLLALQAVEGEEG